MILYFSGTGNSRFVANSLANILAEDSGCIPDMNPDKLSLSGEFLILVFPIYSWGVPPIVMDFIGGISADAVNKIMNDDIPVLMVCTCGDEVAMAPEMFVKQWAQKGVCVKGAWSVIMPNNYVLLPGFNVDKPDVERKKLAHAPIRVKEIARQIKNRQWQFDVTRGSLPNFKTRLIYPLFKRYGINTKRWTVSSDCIGCAKCVVKCPMRNIELKSRHPVWGGNCVSCTACYHSCPAKAVGYSRITNGKGQYFCTLVPLSENQVDYRTGEESCQDAVEDKP